MNLYINSTKKIAISEAEVEFLCYEVKEIFQKQCVLLEIPAPIIVCGILFID